ncbi:hypothetical protein HHK36_021647 [Tetracentron sinense]|uniref:Xyloglucan endotransglucosylase/hydrolase n=1 Tax=Tetracentron sinense TaxID=13715 RepID=A0A835D7J9_TETSI|nr:hypothetical protein HHK36_021647 [Tetracentron sinense]
MGNLQALFIALMISVLAFDKSLVEANFYDSMYFNWGAHHSAILGNGDNLQLVLDKTAGSGVQSKRGFLFGSIEMLIKLVPGNSAGTVTAYYVSTASSKGVTNYSTVSSNMDTASQLPELALGWMRNSLKLHLNFLQLSSTGIQHDEIDFEFLGNRTGQPYIVHTNVYAKGNGSKEQQFYLWFDPTADFHNYTIHWNPSQIVWYIDGLPIRVFRNYEREGVPFPNKQGMKVYSSLWNADNWATRGGLIKIDWRSAPFIARFRTFRARACNWDGPVSISQCASNSLANWWTSPVYSKLSYGKIGQMKWVRDHYMIYDYCKDTLRFNGKMPLECYKQQF